MNARPRFLVLLSLIALLALPAFAQGESPAEETLDIDELRASRERVAGNKDLDSELGRKILEFYDGAIRSLEELASSRDEVKRHSAEESGIGRRVEILRRQLERPEEEPKILTERSTVTQAEGELARERARLRAERTNLRDLERKAEEQAATRNDLSRRLGSLDQEIAATSEELLAVTQADIHPELKRATKANLRAGRERARGQVELLRAQMSLLDARSTLIPWQIDQAQRRVDHFEQVVNLLQEATNALRVEASRQQLQRVRELCARVAEQSAALAGVADDTEAMAETLWGPEGVEAQSEITARRLSLTRKNQSELDRIVQLTRRKYDAFGHRGAITRWWPEIPEDFPKPGKAEAVVRVLKSRIPEVQHEVIRLEQQRSEARVAARATMQELRDEVGEELSPELARLAQELIAQRRDLLEELIHANGRHADQLVELETAASFFVRDEKMVRDFLFELLLWVRSVPRPIVPRAQDLGGAAGWLLSGSAWAEASRALWQGLTIRPGRGLGAILLFALLLAWRRRIRRRLLTLADRVANPETDSFRVTLGALLYTILLAAPLPLALNTAARVLAVADGSPLLFAIARALPYVASMAALIELTRQFLAPGGLAEGHFGWPRRVTRLVYRGLAWREIVFLPLIFCAVTLGMAGMRLDSPERLQLYNNSLGRVCFVAALAILGFSLISLFRPRRGDATLRGSGTNAWLHRLYMFAWPVVVLSAILPAALAAAGYYITGYLLAYQMLRTVWLITGVLVLSGMLIRWRETRRREPEQGAAEAGAPPAELPQAEKQVRQLFRFVVILVAALGLYSIWSEAVPTLQILKRVEVWPRILLAEPIEEADLVISSTTAAKTETAGDPAQAESTAVPKVPGMPSAAGDAAGGSKGAQDGSAPLTLWNLLEAVLAILITVVLVRNIPGLLTLTLSRRTRIDPGARIAAATLIRYAIIIIGASASFTLLGISWSKIQWLAAALTFGLGFGLQEIVANFVSGLILLTERPVRVGDAVTVGNLQGRVSRIQIRATWITLWDRSEMIVPNKEFITTKLVNWTLSDSRRRIDVPVRVAYGADLAAVKETLLEVAQQHPLVFDDPPPSALLLDFGDDAIKFELRGFVDFGNGLQVRDELHMQIDKVFRERGIEFPLPQLNLHLPTRRGERLIERDVPPTDSKD